VFALEAHCLEGREFHRATVSRYRASEEEGSRLVCQGLSRGVARFVGLFCLDHDWITMTVGLAYEHILTYVDSLEHIDIF
jgi:hypothetical protein